MLQWAKRNFQAWCLGMQMREMDDWIAKLRDKDSDEVSCLLMLAMHYRNGKLATTGIDLMNPYAAVTTNPFLAIQLVSEIKDAQRRGMPVVAAGIFVWLFTIRAALAPPLRPGARQLWGQLQCGFAGIAKASHDFASLVGGHPDITDAGKFPDGFTPEPK